MAVLEAAFLYGTYTALPTPLTPAHPSRLAIFLGFFFDSFSIRFERASGQGERRRGPGGGRSAVYVPLLFGPEEFGEGGAAGCVRCRAETPRQGAR